MKKRKPFVMQPLFRREKDMLGIVNDPTKLRKLAEAVAQAKATSENLKKCEDLQGWFAYTTQLLPENFTQKDEFILKLSELINDYSNEPERNESTESC